jgi:hypothetical protein
VRSRSLCGDRGGTAIKKRREAWRAMIRLTQTLNVRESGLNPEIRACPNLTWSWASENAERAKKLIEEAAKMLKQGKQ